MTGAGDAVDEGGSSAGASLGEGGGGSSLGKDELSRGSGVGTVSSDAGAGAGGATAATGTAVGAGMLGCSVVLSAAASPAAGSSTSSTKSYIRCQPFAPTHHCDRKAVEGEAEAATDLWEPARFTPIERLAN